MKKNITLVLGMLFCLLMLECTNNVDISSVIQGKIVISTQNEMSVMNLGSLTKTQSGWNNILATKDEYRYPDLSPDGRQIVVGYLSLEERRRGPTTYYYLEMFNVNGDGQYTLLKDAKNNEYPSWSPDGRMIAFIEYLETSKGRNGRLCTIELATRKVKCVDKYEVNIAKPAWSSDGHFLTFTTAKSDIALYDIRSNAVRILPVVGRSPVFHPDNNRLFYVQNDNQGLCSITINGTDKKIINKRFIDYLVRFSRDGQYLLYVGGGYHAIPPGAEYSTLELLNIKNLKSMEIDRFAGLYGVSWLE